MPGVAGRDRTAPPAAGRTHETAALRELESAFGQKVAPGLPTTATPETGPPIGPGYAALASFCCSVSSSIALAMNSLPIASSSTAILRSP